MAPRLLPASLAAALAVGLLGACTAPPPEAYTTLGGTRAAASRPAGPDARGDACIVQPTRPPALDRPTASGQDVFCGGWTQPAARVFALRGASGATDLDQLAGGGV